MTVYLTNRDGDGKTNEEGHYRLVSKITTGQTVGPESLKVVPVSPLAMSVLVQVGDYRIDTAAGYAYTGWIDSNTTVSITTADPSNPRVTSVVLYVDKTATTSPAPPNNPGITKLMAVNGSASSTPSAPSGSVIQAAVGAGNPYIILANIAVGTAVTQITASNITDLRAPVKLNPNVLNGADLLATVGTLLYPVGSVYINATNSANPATYLGFGTWVAYAQGQVPVGFDTNQTEFNATEKTGGAKTHALTIAELPAHNHAPGTLQVLANVGNVAAGSLNLDDFPGSDGPISATGKPVGNGWSGVTANTGSGTAHNNLQPYITVYMWKRTA